MNKNQIVILAIGMFLILMVFISMEVSLIPYKFSLGQMDVTYDSVASQMIVTDKEVTYETGATVQQEEVNEEEREADFLEHQENIKNMKKSMTSPIKEKMNKIRIIYIPIILLIGIIDIILINKFK